MNLFKYKSLLLTDASAFHCFHVTHPSLSAPKTLTQLGLRKHTADDKHWAAPVGIYLLWPQEVDVDVGISGGRINAVMAEVFTHVLWGGLRQEPINAFPWENNANKKKKKKDWGFVLGRWFWLGFVVV